MLPSLRTSTRLAVLAASLLGALPAWAQAQNVVTSVAFKNGNIEIAAQAPPNFTTFTMSDPNRLVVDISNCVLKGVPADQPVNQGPITSIKTLGYGAGASAVTRVLIGFSKEVDTDLATSGNTLIVKIGGAPAVAAAAPAAAPAPAPAAEPAPAPSAPVAQNDAPPPANDQPPPSDEPPPTSQPTPAAPAPEAPPPSKPMAVAEAEGAPPPAAPPPQAAPPPAAPPPEAAPPPSAPVAQNDQPPPTTDQPPPTDDTGASAPQPAPTQAAPAPAPVAQQQQPPPPAADQPPPTEGMPPPTEAPPAPAAAQAAATPALPPPSAYGPGNPAPPPEGAPVDVSRRQKRIALVGFRASDSQVFIRTNEPVSYNVADGPDGSVLVTIENTRIVRHNDRRPIDAHFFPTPVAMIQARQVRKNVVVEIRLKNHAPYRTVQRGQEVELNFTNGSVGSVEFHLGPQS